MTILAVQILGSALMSAAGIAAARHSMRAATWAVGAMLPLLLLKGALAQIPAAEPTLLPWDWYPYVEGWWFVFPSMLILSAAITLYRGSMWRRDGLLVVTGLLLLYCGMSAVLMARPHELTGQTNAKGICHQTSGYSCSAASASMLLHRYGVAASEQEMAELCVTRAGNSRVAGTTESGIMRGLRIKLRGLGKPVISTPSYDTLRAPSIVPIQLSPQLSHSILIAGVEPGQVKVVDPLYGFGTIPRAQFERAWKGTAIHVERSEVP